MAKSTYPDGREWKSKLKDRDIGSGWIEPESAANEDSPPQYPYNNITQSESGHVFEIDDTPERERVRLQHRSGTFIEMHPNGDEVHKVYGDGYEITVFDKNILIQGHCSVTIEGDSIVNVKGDKIEKIDGDYNLYVGGKYNHVTKGESNILCESDMRIGAGGSMSDAAGSGSGSLRLVSGNELYITADVMVGGSIVAEMISSKTSVDAGLGITAGPLGFVTIKGGVSVGIPIAKPGIVNCSGTVNAPLGTFGTMRAVLMTDILNTGIYGKHIHIAPHGPTSKPIIGMM